MSEQYAIYLRKSRRDEDYSGENIIEDTLRVHEKTLLALAKKQSLSVTRIFKEVVSGDTVSERPEVQKLLDEVSAGIYAGVLVMDIDRLARGDTSDQGLIAKAFSYSHTKIITPHKTYDPDNEFDVEYFEFGLFMSRREYTLIKRRLLRGRLAAVKDGKWVGGVAPFGYRRIKLEKEKGYILEPDEHADNARTIFSLYASGMGSRRVCRELESLGIRNRKGLPFVPADVLTIVQNPVYLGMTKFGSRPDTPRLENGVKKISRPRAVEYLLVKARWDALIDQETWDLCQFHRKNNKQITPNANKTLQNPLAGVLVCGVCGKSMTRLWDHRRGKEYGACDTMNCPTCAAEISRVEAALLDSLRSFIPSDSDSDSIDGIAKIRKEKESITKQLAQLDGHLKKLYVQRNSLHDLLEQGVYTVDTFLARQAKISQDIESAQNLHASLSATLDEKKKSLDMSTNLIPRLKATVETYETLKNAEAKNLVLKSILRSVAFHKTEQGTRRTPAPFYLELILKS